MKRVNLFLRQFASSLGELVLNTIVFYMSVVFFIVMMIHEAVYGRPNQYWKERFTHYVNLVTHFPDYLAFKLKNTSFQLNSFFNSNKD